MPFDLTAGRWALTVTATSPEGKVHDLTRNVTVAYNGVNVVVAIRDGRAWLKVWVDGKVDERLGAAGRVYGDGKTLTFTGEESVEVRTGNAAATYFTVNGTDIGRLSERQQPRHVADRSHRTRRSAPTVADAGVEDGRPRTRRPWRHGCRPSVSTAD